MAAKTQALSLKQIVLPAGIGTALSLVGDSALYTVLPTHTAVAGLTLASVGIMLSANRFIRLPANPLAGWLSDRCSKRTVFVSALFLGALSTAIYGLTSGFWPILLGRLLWGIAWAGIWVAGNGLTLATAPAVERGRWVGRYHLFFFLGAALGAFLGGWLTDLLGFKQAMLIASGLGFAGAVIALLFLPDVPGSKSAEPVKFRQPAGESGNPTYTPPVEEERKTKWGELLSVTAVLGVNRLVIAGILASTFALFLADMFGTEINVAGWIAGTATITGLLLGTRILLGVVLTPLIGSLSDRKSNRWRIVAGGLLPGITGFILLAFNAPLAMLLGLPLTTVSGSSNQSLSTALIGDLGARRKQGRHLGLLYMVGDLGSAIGPLLAFALIPLWDISGLYWFSALMFALLLILALFWAFKGSSDVK